MVTMVFKIPEHLNNKYTKKQKTKTKQIKQTNKTLDRHPDTVQPRNEGHVRN